MATVNLTTAPTQVDDGSSYTVLVTNTGAVEVDLSRGGRLRPGQSRTVYPEGVALTAASTSGAGQVSTVTTGKPLPNPSDPTALAANPAFTGTYASILPSVGERLRRAAAAASATASLVGVPLASPPTVSQGTSNQDAALTKSYLTASGGTSALRITGGTSTQGAGSYTAFRVAPVVTLPSGSGGNTRGDATKNCYQWTVEFVTDAPKVQVAHVDSSSSTRWMVEVDGQPVSTSALTYPGNTGGTGYALLNFTVGSATIVASTGVFTTPTAHGLNVGDQVTLGTITSTTGATAGTPYYVLTVPSSTTFTLSATPGGAELSLTTDGSTTSVSQVKTRRFRFEYQLNAGFLGVYVGPQFNVWAPQSPTNLRVATVGDSIDAGTGAALPNGQWSKVAAKLLGWTDVRNVSFAGTGFVNVGSSLNTFGAALRVSDVVAANPELLIISASQNDDAQSGLQAAALTAFRAYRAALPTVPIVVVGADSASSGATGPSAARITTDTTVKAAFDQWADPNSWWIPNCQDPNGSWQYGTGTAASRTGTGNRDRFGFDSAHPNDAGHAFLARRFEQSFRTLVLPYIK